MTYEKLEKTEKSDEIYDNKNWRNISPNVFLGIEYADSEEMACKKASIRRYKGKNLQIKEWKVTKIIIDEFNVTFWLSDKNGNCERS